MVFQVENQHFSIAPMDSIKKRRTSAISIGFRFSNLFRPVVWHLGRLRLDNGMAPVPQQRTLAGSARSTKPFVPKSVEDFGSGDARIRVWQSSVLFGVYSLLCVCWEPVSAERIFPPKP